MEAREAIHDPTGRPAATRRYARRTTTSASQPPSPWPI